MQRAADAETIHELGHHIGTRQPTMTLLVFRPRVREEEPNAGEFGELDPRQELQCVALDHPHMLPSLIIDGFQHLGNTGCVDIDSDHCFLWTSPRQFDQALATAEPDVEHDLGRAEQRGEIDSLAFHRQRPLSDEAVVALRA